MTGNAMMVEQYQNSESSERNSHGAILGLIVLAVFGGLSFLTYGPGVAPRATESVWRGMGYAVQIMCGYAALAGGFTVAVCLTLKGSKRAMLLILAGLVPIVIALLGPASRRLLFPEGAPSELWLGALAWLGMVVGARVSLHRPGCRAGVLAGGFSAAVFLVLLIPLPLGSEGGWVSLWRTPIRLFLGGSVLSAGAMFLAFISSALAAMSCLSGLVGRSASRQLARAVFRMLAISGVCLVIACYQPAFSGVDGLDPHADAFGFVVRYWIMPVGWTGALLLVVAYGLTDLLVGLVPFHTTLDIEAQGAAPGVRRPDAAGALQSYKEMLSRGDITQEEYDRHRADLLSRMQGRDKP